MSFPGADSAKQVPTIGSAVPPVRSAPGSGAGVPGAGPGMLSGNSSHSLGPHSSLFDSTAPRNEPFAPAPPPSLASKPAPPPLRSQHPSFPDDNMARNGQPEWGPSPAGAGAGPGAGGRGYSGLPMPSFLGMDDSSSVQHQHPHQHQQPSPAQTQQAPPQPPPPPPQHGGMYPPPAYGHFDQRYAGQHPPPPGVGVGSPMRAPEPDRAGGFFAHSQPGLYSGTEGGHPGPGSEYGLFGGDPNQGRMGYHPGASVLGRPDPRGMPPPFGTDRGGMPLDARYMGPPMQQVRKVPDPPFFEGASTMVPAPITQKRPKARIDGAARKRICQFAELNPEMRQADVAAAFNVERSTVSKILKQKAKWLAYEPDDPNASASTTSDATKAMSSRAGHRAPNANSRRQSSTTASLRDPGSSLSSPQTTTRSPLTSMPTPELGVRAPPSAVTGTGAAPKSSFLSRPQDQDHQHHS